MFMLIWLFRSTRWASIVHIHGCSYFGFFPIIIGVISSKLLLNKNTVVTYHGGGADSFLSKNAMWVRWFLRKADCVTVMSDYLRDVFSKYRIDTRILQNVIDVDIALYEDEDFLCPKILSIRSLSKLYNIDVIIDAFMTIKSEYACAELIIAGDGDEQYSLQGKARDDEAIKFIGRIPNSEIPSLMKKCNIFVSVPSADNQPMSIIEAFCSNILVISSNVGGVRDMVSHMENGLLVEPRNSSQINEMVSWIMKNKHHANTMRKNALDSAKFYSWSRVYPILLDIYSR